MEKMDSLTISCSPDTYHRVKNDKEYRLRLTQSVLSEQEASFSEVIFTQTAPEETVPEHSIGQRPAEADGFMSVNEESNDIEKENWNDASTKLMLSLMEDLRPKLGKSVNVKTKTKMYQTIKEKMIAEGYNFSPLQIQNKFRGLERTYKKMVLHNRQTGRNRQTCSYESELHRILGEKKGIHPEFVLESGDAEGRSYSEVSVDESSDTDHTPKDDEQSPGQFRKPKPGVRQQVMQKMDQLLAEKKDFHTKVMDLLQKKEERAQKRDERSQRKLELLELLVQNKK